MIISVIAVRRHSHQENHTHREISEDSDFCDQVPPWSAWGTPWFLGESWCRGLRSRLHCPVGWFSLCGSVGMVTLALPYDVSNPAEVKASLPSFNLVLTEIFVSCPCTRRTWYRLLTPWIILYILKINYLSFVRALYVPNYYYKGFWRTNIIACQTVIIKKQSLFHNTRVISSGLGLDTE